MKHLEPVTMTHAVKEAAKTQSSTVMAAGLILLAYVAGMTVTGYCSQLLDPPSKSDIFR
ncbi:hypothetical protein [Aminobacter phage Erebus]|nr:hypothetical protein [Aminobacter phage Erebus]